MHLTEHTQYVEGRTRRFLYSHEEILNDLNKKFKNLSIPSRILENPFLQLEKWRRDAHQKLDQLAQQKRQEIQQKISEYQIEFTKKTNEQKQKIEILIKRLNYLSRQTQIANKDIKYLEEKILESKNFLQSLDQHSIKVSTYAFCVNIQTNFFDSSRNPRPESVKHRFQKKRSLSVSLL
jgi:exonuclease VII large subunit